jgi:hypothetical protein
MIASLLGSSLILVALRIPFEKPTYQRLLELSAVDSGVPNCPDRYLAFPVLARCLGNGNRSCIIGIATEAAYRGQDQVALYLAADITECQDPIGHDALYDVGAPEVGGYLRRKYSEPIWGPALDLSVLFAQ